MTKTVIKALQTFDPFLTKEWKNAPKSSIPGPIFYH